MRRILFAFSLMSFVTSTAMAQSVALRPYVGLNIGFATATENAITTRSTGSPRVSFLPGVGVEIPLAPGFSLLPEARYIARGADLQLIGFIPGTVTFDMLDFPVLLKYTGHGRTRFCGELGPHFGILLSRQLNVAGIIAADLSNLFSSTDFGITAGVGIEHDIDDTFGLFLDMRFQLGIKDLNGSANNDYRSRDLQFLAGTKILF